MMAKWDSSTSLHRLNYTRQLLTLSMMIAVRGVMEKANNQNSLPAVLSNHNILQFFSCSRFAAKNGNSINGLYNLSKVANLFGVTRPGCLFIQRP